NIRGRAAPTMQTTLSARSENIGPIVPFRATLDWKQANASIWSFACTVWTCIRVRRVMPSEGHGRRLKWQLSPGRYRSRDGPYRRLWQVVDSQGLDSLCVGASRLRPRVRRL